MQPKQTDPQYKLRLTPEIKRELESAARKNGRSLNSEILKRLEESFSSQERIMELRSDVLSLHDKLRMRDEEIRLYQLERTNLAEQIVPKQSRSMQASKDQVSYVDAVKKIPRAWLQQEINQELSESLEKALERVLERKLDIRSLARKTANDEAPEQITGIAPRNNTGRAEHTKLPDFDEEDRKRLIENKQDAQPDRVEPKKKKLVLIRRPAKKS